MTDHVNAVFNRGIPFFTYFYLPLKYIIQGNERTRLMRYFLLLSLAKALLTRGIIETTGAALLVLFSGTGQ